MGLTPAQREAAAAASPAAWSYLKRGLAPAEQVAGLRSFHLDCYGLLRGTPRLVIVAPRSFGKSEMSVCYLAWRCIHEPGVVCQIFSATELQAAKLKRRVDAAIAETRPDLLPRRGPSDTRTQYVNGSIIEAAGAGAASRGIHPDVIVGDDVVTEESGLSQGPRKRLEDWWVASVGGMAHPGVTRVVQGRRRTFSPSQIALVGTPFHPRDLLGSLKDNSQWTWRRYAAEFDPDDCQMPPSPAVEVGDGPVSGVPTQPVPPPVLLEERSPGPHIATKVGLRW